MTEAEQAAKWLESQRFKYDESVTQRELINTLPERYEDTCEAVKGQWATSPVVATLDTEALSEEDAVKIVGDSLLILTCSECHKPQFEVWDIGGVHICRACIGEAWATTRVECEGEGN